MLDRIPFGGSARIMADGDGQLIRVHQFLLKRQLPGAAARAIAAAAIGQDKQLGRVGIAAATFAAPPLAKGFHREEWRVVGGAHDDSPTIGLNVVNSVRDGQTLGLRTEVVVLDQKRVRLHTRPLFLNWPTSSFFLVSTLI